MKFSHRRILILLSLLLSAASVTANDECLDIEVNFAWAGANTDTRNRALECLGGLLRPCSVVEERKELLEKADLILPGLVQQVDFAVESLKHTGTDEDLDLYMILAGVNDFLGPWPTWRPDLPGIPGTPVAGYGDPLPPGFDLTNFPLTAAYTVGNLAQTLERVYNEFNARYIIMANWVPPCTLPLCTKIPEPVPGFGLLLDAYSQLWGAQFNAGLQKVVDDFNAAHTEATVVLVDLASHALALLQSPDFIDASCRDALNGGEDIPGPDANGYFDCKDYAWTDDVHPTSKVWRRLIDEAFIPDIAAAIPDVQSKFRRLISFGDSYSDLGSYHDTVCQADSVWCSFSQTPPKNGVADQNGRGLVEMLEESLGIPPSLPYIQKNPAPFCPPSPGLINDPHLRSWSGEWFDYMGECDLKLMHVPSFDGKHDMDIHVRTKIRYHYSFIEAAALRIGEDVLEVGSWAAYAVNGVEGALGPRDQELPQVGANSIYHTLKGERNHLFEVVIGKDLNVTISTFKDWVSVKIVGAVDRATFGSVSGLMGTYDGKMLARNGTDLHDNINALGQDWQVQPEEDMLFRTVREPQAPEKCLLPSAQSKVARRLGDTVSREAAEKACARLKGSAFSFCVHDVIVNGDLELAESAAF